MRARLFRWFLSHLERHTPGWIRLLEIQILLNLASRSFGGTRKRIWHLAAPDALQAYAAYTVECMNTTSATPEQLYENARQLGKRLRMVTGLTETEDLQRLVFYLYQNISITMYGSLPGEITVPFCFFSSFYTPAQCALMSHVDAGIIAGLFNGGTLQFSERLTEGCSRCLACFRKKGAESSTTHHLSQKARSGGLKQSPVD